MNDPLAGRREELAKEANRIADEYDRQGMPDAADSVRRLANSTTLRHDTAARLAVILDSARAKLAVSELAIDDAEPCN